jgi:hypothetical protein
LLAERFGADTGRIARIILLTTAAAFLTFSAAVALRVLALAVPVAHLLAMAAAMAALPELLAAAAVLAVTAVLAALVAVGLV